MHRTSKSGHCKKSPIRRIIKPTNGGFVMSKRRYTYDGNGNVLTMTDALSGVVASTYASMNRVHTSTDKLGALMTYAYDAAGKVITITDAQGKTTNNTFDANRNLTQLTNRNNELTTYSYDSMNRRTKGTNGRGITKRVMPLREIFSS
jgi:YD repeat-containing protein